jgi:translocation and assembly module TamB
MDAPSSAPQPARTPASRRWRIALRALVALLIAALVCAALTVALVVWAARSEAGMRTLLSFAPGVRVSAPSGTLIGDFGAERIEIALPRDGAVVLTQFRWRGLRPERLASAPWGWRVVIDVLETGQVQLQPGTPADSEPSRAAPRELTLPIAVDIAQLRVDDFSLLGSTLAPVRDLRARLSFAGGAGSHRIDGLHLLWDRLRLEGSASLGAQAPLPLDATLTLAEITPAVATAPATAPPAATATAPPPATATTPSGAAKATAPRGAASAPAPAGRPPGGAAPASAAASAPAPGISGWTAQLAANGPLERLALSAALRARAQRLDASAEVTPFAALPISRVDARTEALDLSVLASRAPKTSLSGQLRASLEAPSSGRVDATMPLAIQADLRNDAAGRWDAGQLPVQRLLLDASGNAGDARRGELRRFEIQLGSTAHQAGALTGSGRWDGVRWWLDAALQDIAPAALDQRAPPLVLGGTLRLQGTGGLPGAAPAAAPLSVDAIGKLHGRMQPQPNRAKGSKATPPGGLQSASWQLELDGAANANEITVRQLEASSSGASARLKGSARRADAAAWQVRGEIALVNVNPSLLPDAARLKGSPSRLNGDARFDLLLPERPPAGVGLTPWLAAWRGNAHAVVRDSQLAGIPLAGELQLEGAPRSGVTFTASMAAANNRFALRGLLDAQSADGAGDRWTLEAAAPALAALVPALRLFRPDMVVGGALTANAEVSGRWPALTSRGELTTDALTLPGLILDAAQARWHLGTAPNGPATLQFRARHIAIGEQRLESPQVQVEGSGSSHVAKLRVEMVPPVHAEEGGKHTTTAGAGTSERSGNGGQRVAPTSAAAASVPAGGSATATTAPAGTTPASASASAAPTQRLLATAEAQGGWHRDTATATLGWRGRIRQLEVQAMSAASAPSGSDAQPAPVWLRADPFDLSWSQGASGQRLNATATRLVVLDAALRLRALDYATAPGQAMQVDVQAELEPLAVAPLLARLQPDFGWGGTLTVAGRLSVRSGASGVVADAVLERTAGDLHVTDPSLVPTIAPGSAAASAVVAASAPASAPRTTVRGVTQRLGLREGRVALSAREGVWRFSQQLEGRNLGTLAGQQTVRSDPRAVWPPPESPLEGGLDVQVDNLSTWGGWVPAGWRLVGKLAMQARLSGRFGAPEYTGRLTGSGLGARHLLAGIDVSDGELAIALEGPSARIERLLLHAGDGTARVDGRADFGETPRAQLKLVADHFRLLGRVDRKVVVSGQAQIDLERDALKLDGRFAADEGLIDIAATAAPSVSDDVTVVGRDDGDEAEGSADAPRRNVSIRLAVDLGERFRLKGRGLDTLLRGALELTAPGGQPQLVGVIRTEGGSFNAYAQKLTIERGSVTFNGPVNNPRLDILALRTQSATASETDVKVGVTVTGPALNPRVRLYSVPEMSETEKLSWLVLGRGPSELGRSEVALVQQAALALLAGEDGGVGAEDVMKSIGLDEFSVRQNDGEVRETVVTLGKQISNRWFVGYERSLNATAGSWQLIYRVANRFTVRAQSGFETSIDAFWTWRWQ